MKQTMLIFGLTLAVCLGANAAAEPLPESWQGLYDAAEQAIDRNRLKRAEKLLDRALELAETFEPGDKRYLRTVNRLAGVYHRTRRGETAIALYERAREHYARGLGLDHPESIPLILELAVLEEAGQDPAAAEELYRRAVFIARGNGDDPRRVADSVIRLAGFYKRTHRPTKAIPLYESLLDLRGDLPEQRIAWCAAELARLYLAQDRYAQAEALFVNALAVYETLYATHHPMRVQLRQDYAVLLREVGRNEEAAELARVTEEAALPEPDPAFADPDEVFVGGQDGVTQARVIHRLSPSYPERARVKRLGGRVVLQVTVLADGTVGDVDVLRCSNPGAGFEEEAIRTVKQWRYEPATKDGVPVAVFIAVNVDFKLN